MFSGIIESLGVLVNKEKDGTNKTQQNLNRGKKGQTT